MAKFQIIEEKGKPKFVVLPYGDQKAAEDYCDEVWALKSIKKYESRKNKSFVNLEDVRHELPVKSKKINRS